MSAKIQRSPNGISYNVASWSGPVSTTSALETTAHSVSFVAPASGAVKLYGAVTATLAGNGVSMQSWLDIASGPTNSRMGAASHVHTSTQRKSLMLSFRVSGLIPGETYTARIRWLGPGGTTRSVAANDNEEIYILVENYSS